MGGALGAGVFWGLADGWRIHDAAREAGGNALPVGLGLLLVLGAFLGALLAGAWWLLAALGDAATRRSGSPWGRILLPVAAGAAALAWMIHESFQGVWVRAQWWAPWAEGILVLLALGCLTAAARLVHWALGDARPDAAGPPSRGRAGLLLSLAVLAALALFMVRPRIPATYPALHLGCALGLAGLGALAGALLAWLSSPRMRRGLVAAGTMLVLAACLLLLRGELPGRDPTRAYLLRDKAPLSAVVLHLLVPVRHEDDVRVGSRAVEEVLPPQPLPAAVYDDAFPGRRRWNLLLVTFDALRADHVGHLGYERATTPELDELARESIVFEAAYATFPSSFHSMTSMFTGLYPSSIPPSGAARKDPRAGDAWRQPYLAEVLGKRGFRTQAVTAFSDTVFKPLFPWLDRGFDTFVHADGPTWLQSDEVVDRALELLSRQSDEPWFLWVHLFDPHEHYVPHEGFSFGDRRIDLYDGEIAHADHHLGRLLEHLRSRPEWERTLVVVHSDHGEEFGDHGGWRHGSTLYEEQVRIPLVIRVPGGRPRRVARPVDLAGLAPTLLDLLGAERPAGIQGRSFAPLLLDDGEERETVPPLAFMELLDPRRAGGLAAALRQGRFKLIQNRMAGTLQLYDLHDDPRERSNLAGRRPEIVRRLREVLGAFHAMQARRRGGSSARDEALMEVREIERKVLEGGDAERRKALVRLCDLGRKREAEALLAGLLAPEASLKDRAEALRLLARFPLEVPMARIAEAARDRDRRLRMEAAACLGRKQPPSAGVLLAELARDADGDVRTVARMALVRLGAEEAPEWLAGAIAREDLPHRDLALQALTRAGVGPWRRRALLQLHWWPLWWHQHDLLRVFSSVRDARVLPALYMSRQATLQPVFHDRLLFETALAQGLDALPHARLALDARSPELRSRAREWLAEQGLDDLQTSLRRAQDALMRVENLAAVKGEEARRVELMSGALEELLAKNIADWGVLLEAWNLRAELQGPAAAAKIFEDPRVGEVFDRGVGAMVRERLRALGATLDRPAEITVEPVALDAVCHPEKAPFMWRFRVGAAASGGGVRGGFGLGAPEFYLWCRSPEGGGPTPLLVMCLPWGGLLPGESIEFVMLADELPIRDGRRTFGISFRHGARIRHPCFTREVDIRQREAWR